MSAAPANGRQNDQEEVIDLPSITFGLRLKALRNRYGLKQNEMADKLGIHRSSYSAYEADRDKPREGIIDFAHRLEQITRIEGLAMWLCGFEPELKLRTGSFLTVPTCMDALQNGQHVLPFPELVSVP